MGTKNIAVSVDEDVLKRFDGIVGKSNRSSTITRLMDGHSAISKGDIDSINVEILRREIEEEDTIIIEHQQIRDNKKRVLDSYHKKLEQDEIYKLKKERNILEESTKCINCTGPAGIDAKKFTKGLVCNDCFMVGTGEDVKRWS